MPSLVCLLSLKNYIQIKIIKQKNPNYLNFNVFVYPWFKPAREYPLERQKLRHLATVIELKIANEFWPGVHELYDEDCIAVNGILVMKKSQFTPGLKQPR